MSEGFVKNEMVKEGVACITFYHPKHNALPGYLLQKLEAEIINAGQASEVKVIILQSGGDRTFCAGASFDELLAIQNQEQGKRFFQGFANVINACRKCPKLIIGRVQGKAVGGGVGLAAAVDYCMASSYASIKLSELNIGIGPFVIGPAVERKIGKSAFMQLTINADEFRSAVWAEQRGLYAEVYDSQDDLDKGVLNLADYLLTKSTAAQRALKQMFWENCQHWDQLLDERASISGKLVLSEETKAALNEYRDRG